ncbi:MAG: Na(+)-translocating NADH-quinone reductase subunit C [Ignavibacteriae bacterium]|nr:Na(+)-translocating NADH-quinone reductase subunit C [Ignavibacteriota bacterium]
MSSDSTKKTIGVALGVCLACSVFVSSATVALDSIQKQNKKLDKMKNILQAGNLSFNEKNAEEVFKDKIVSIIIDLENGSVIDKSQYSPELNPDVFNIKTLSESKKFGTDILPDKDLGNIKKRPNFMLGYEVVNENQVIEKYILPIFGKGLWSTMYGFLALNKDLKTVEGITFYEHGETPGLGGEIDNQSWKASWKGKQLFDQNGSQILEILKGKVDPNDSNKNSQIDGLSGATLTTRGVDNTIKYWMGNDGYAKFLENLRKDI